MKSSKLLFSLPLIISSTVWSATTLEENLSFGNIAIASNASVSQIIVSRNGSTSSTNTVFIIEPGTPGRITFSDYAPGTRFYISAQIPSPQTGSIGTTEQFTLTAIDIVSSIDIEASGGATLTFGGTLETSGNGGAYVDTVYTTGVNILINF